jgi:anti-sigma factor RsiW
MKCPDDEKLEGLWDENLAEGERAEIAAHVDGCARCWERLENLSRADAAAREALAALKACAPPLPIAAIGRKGRRLAMPMGVAAAAAVMMIAVGVGGLWIKVHLASVTRPSAGNDASPVQHESLPGSADYAAGVAVPDEETAHESRQWMALERGGRQPADTMPDWQAEGLRRMLAQIHGMIPRDSG